MEQAPVGQVSEDPDVALDTFPGDRKLSETPL